MTSERARPPSSLRIKSDSMSGPRPPVPSVGHLCGLWYWRPRWLQPLATIRVFIVCVCLFSCICSALNSGYVVSMISTIERRFEIGSTLAGFMTSCYEIGYIPAVVLVSYLGGSRRKPVWIATGAVVMAIGALIFTLPQFIAKPYLDSKWMEENESVQLCRAGNWSQGKGDDPCLGLKGGYGGNSNTFNVFLIVLANVLLGCGASPILTLGTTFIDDHTSPETAPPLIATIYASAAVGPMVGHLVGAVMLQYYVDQHVYDSQKLKIKPGDPAWVGAWWGGFILFGLLCVMCSVPLYMFPARLKVWRRSKQPYELPSIASGVECAGDVPGPVSRIGEESPGPVESVDEASQPLRAMKEVMETGGAEVSPGADSAMMNFDPVTTDFGKRWQDLPRSILQLIKNRIYLVTCTGICFEMAVINAFGVFLPKYIETQFSVANFTASVLTGSCAVPAGALGIMAGGLLCRKLGLNRRGAVKVVLLANIAVLILYFLSFIIGCENVQVAGLNIPYSANRTWSGAISVQNECNSGCGRTGGLCDEVIRNPVCSKDLGVTYLSPCHAGCTDFNSSSVFTNCSCLTAAGLPSDAVVHRGECSVHLSEGSCAQHKLVPFLIFLCLTIFMTALTQNPLLMVTMRSVRLEQRAFALGFQFVILRLFGYIPAPITFGRVIDSTCLHWLQSKQCPAASGSSSDLSSAAAAAAAVAMSAGIPGGASESETSATSRLSGSCLFYNVVLFRNKVFGLALGLKFASLVVYVILWSLLKRDCLGAEGSVEEVNAVVSVENGTRAPSIPGASDARAEAVTSNDVEEDGKMVKA